jgi:hypothetical protein
MMTGPIWFVALLVTVLLVIALLWFAVGFLRANSALWRGDLDAVTSDDAPTPEPAGAGGARFGADRRSRVRWSNASYAGVVGAVLMAALQIGVWGSGNQFSFSDRKAPRSFSAVSGPSASESEGKFVLYTMPAPGTNSPGAGYWNFKCLLPAEHLVRLLFIRWTNGVPTIAQRLSAYYKVGKAPIDGDFRLSCERLAGAASTGSTNEVQWNVGLIGHGAFSAVFPGESAFRPLETPGVLTVRSGHQGTVRLVDYVTPERQASHGQSGVELRIFVEPWKLPPLRTDPFEVEGTNYVAGHWAGWTTEDALKAIKQWPADQ